MTDKTFKESLQTTRDNLTAMGQLCHAQIIKTTPYVGVEGNTLPIIDFVVSGMNYQRFVEGFQLFTINLRMRVIVDQFLAGFEGNRQQDAYFDYLPTVLQYFAQHPSLAYMDASNVRHASPPYIDDENTAITSAQVGVDNGRIVITLNWNILYRTSFAQLC